MFTGIIEELGVVKSLDKRGTISKLQILAPKVTKGTEVGQSICVNGACLTIVETEKDLLRFEVMQETLKRTNLGLLKPENKVNLERALRADGRIDGHFVSGHIDGTGVISTRLPCYIRGGQERQTKDGDIVIEIEAPEQILRYIVLKGSVALDGISLTVSAFENAIFSVNLVSYTIENTTLGFKKEGDTVNIECDILAKYIDKFLSQNNQSSTSNITPSFLREHGFI